MTALGARGGLGDSDRMTIAELALGGDKSVEAELLISAARSAVALSDVALGERFVRAALERDGGITAADLFARALLWQGRAHEVEEVLDGFDPDTLDEVSLLRWGMTRVSNSTSPSVTRTRRSFPGLVEVEDCRSLGGARRWRVGIRVGLSPEPPG